MLNVIPLSSIPKGDWIIHRTLETADEINRAFSGIVSAVGFEDDPICSEAELKAIEGIDESKKVDRYSVISKYGRHNIVSLTCSCKFAVLVVGKHFGTVIVNPVVVSKKAWRYLMHSPEEYEVIIKDSLIHKLFLMGDSFKIQGVASEFDTWYSKTLEEYDFNKESEKRAYEEYLAEESKCDFVFNPDEVMSFSKFIDVTRTEDCNKYDLGLFEDFKIQIFKHRIKMDYSRQQYVGALRLWVNYAGEELFCSQCFCRNATLPDIVYNILECCKREGHKRYLTVIMHNHSIFPVSDYAKSVNFGIEIDMENKMVMIHDSVYALYKFHNEFQNNEVTDIFKVDV